MPSACNLVTQALGNRGLTGSGVVSLAVWVGVHMAGTLRELSHVPADACASDVLSDPLVLDFQIVFEFYY